MFGNKKKNLLPRPTVPQLEQIVEDLSSTTNHVEFTVKEPDHSELTNLHFPTNAHDVENTYGKVRTYLNSNVKIKLLDETLSIEREKLEASYETIVTLAQDIRNQAQAILVK